MANSVTLPGVNGHSTWTCRTQERQLSDVLLPVHIGTSTEDLSRMERDTASDCILVLLEQMEDGSQCVLTLSCGPQPPALITSLLIISEARTMEVYAQTGDYCGTGRGERDHTIQPDNEDRGPFYRKQLLLDCPSTSCEVKLLSLGGRSSVLVSRIILGLQLQEQPTDWSPRPGLGPSIDMQRVQSLVDEMGSSLSPGAQSLMDMVHFQQKNQANALSSFLPALMGAGALSVLSRGANRPPDGNVAQPAGTRLPWCPVTTTTSGPQPPASTPRPPEPDRPSQNGALLSDECDSASHSPGTLSHSENPGPFSHAQLAEMMSHFLNGQVPGQGSGQALSSAPDLLPMLQSVCGQVTQLRLDNAAAAQEAERRKASGAWELDPAMEQRLEEMERRLKEHMDRRLDALEQRLEKALLSALPLVTLQQVTQAVAGPCPDQTLQQGTQAAAGP